MSAALSLGEGPDDKAPPRGGPSALSGLALRKHSIVIAGHRTSLSLEDAFWSRLRMLAAARGVPIAQLVAEIDATRGEANLSSAIRVHLLKAAVSGA